MCENNRIELTIIYARLDCMHKDLIGQISNLYSKSVVNQYQV